MSMQRRSQQEYVDTSSAQGRDDGDPRRKPRADVRAVDIEGARVAIITDWGYTIADIRSGTLRNCDVLEGDFDTPGRVAWNNLSTGEEVIVAITHVQATRVVAQQLMQRRAGIRRSPTDSI
ncbi:MAG TPA: hypothetical protein VLI06_18070 [Solimonas sp.]|nr:hypothetical protein [Solimonas sp.]